ncbi:uncharacterized protein LAESUDRAFT_748255 [Laetiporus sulphureus 93-53]|uniref:Uncharacterized protein n=1 Tax=Laetiporus sulphureus 93-53 TaxID=1314785 RepID=A0A165G168_9APHY|nr:uncharacterized protein LAESUDRAFT_748255 [Laetiporus sulphureus 93-53]KZT09691.1 hypothetical protein LAESUDRAFT_748255 [Laetiporus sulphureus 93-53]
MSIHSLSPLRSPPKQCDITCPRCQTSYCEGNNVDSACVIYCGPHYMCEKMCQDTYNNMQVCFRGRHTTDKAEADADRAEIRKRHDCQSETDAPHGLRELALDEIEVAGEMEIHSRDRQRDDEPPTSVKHPSDVDGILALPLKCVFCLPDGSRMLQASPDIYLDGLDALFE